MNTPFEESNLSEIGSDEDKAAREAAAKLEMHWEGAGETPGVEIWRVENTRDEQDNPVFGIKPWPKEQYGAFYRGDSYIVLHTQKDADTSKLFWDVFFWIGSESSQDEYGVAAYKANELDDLLGDAPVQHRECEGYESEDFMNCFPKAIRYLEGGIESGFRKVDTNAKNLEQPSKLFRIHRSGRATRAFEVPMACSSLDDGDAFVLDATTVVYTWFGASVSPFEKSKSAEIAHNLTEGRHGHCHYELDVGNENETFWELLGGKGPIQPASEPKEEEVHETRMYQYSEKSGKIVVQQVEVSKDNLESDDIAAIDEGKSVYVWIGKQSSKREQQQAMLLVEKHLENLQRTRCTSVMRVLEGTEGRVRGFQNIWVS